MRLLLLLLIMGAVGLYYTNPTTQEARAKVKAEMLSQLGLPVGGVPSIPGLPGEFGALASDRLTREIQLDRQDYYLFSVFKVTIGGSNATGATPEGVSPQGGQQLPGCLIGVAAQVVPYDKC